MCNTVTKKYEYFSRRIIIWPIQISKITLPIDFTEYFNNNPRTFSRCSQDATDPGTQYILYIYIHYL